jgi:hypothetical protein
MTGLDMATALHPSVPPSVYFEADLELARREARCGEPLGLVGLQWPHLRATSAERDLFNGDLRLDAFQVDILCSAFDLSITELFIKGCTKPGKGFAVALVANLWFDVFPESRIIIASERIDHARDVVFAEIAALREQMRARGPGRLLRKGIADSPKHYLAIANPLTGEGFSGQHGSWTLFLFDEASAVPDDFYDQARKQARLIIALSNPRTLGGWFRRGFPAHAPDDNLTIDTSFGRRRCLTVGGTDCLNVRHRRLEKPLAPAGGITIGSCHFRAGEPIPDECFNLVRPIIPNQLDYARYCDILTHPDPRHRDVFGEGRFPTEDAQMQVVLPSWLPRHEAAWTARSQSITVEAFGLDVAASLLGDETILAAGGREGLRCLHSCRNADTMQTVAWVIATARDIYGIELAQGVAPIAVDTDGLGKGIADRLAELGAAVIEIRGNRAADCETSRYANKRAEIYGELARRLDPDGPWGCEAWPLVPDPMLHEELAAPQRIYASDGVRFRITPKDRMPGSTFKGETLREKLGRSPDRGDATAYLYAAIRSLDASGPALLERPLLLVTPEENDRLEKERRDRAANRRVTNGGDVCADEPWFLREAPPRQGADSDPWSDLEES